MESLLETAIKTEGEDAVAYRLEKHASEVQDAIHLILYESGGVNGGDKKIGEKLTELATILKGSALTQEELAYIQDMKENLEAT